MNFPNFCTMCGEEVEEKGVCEKCKASPMRSVIKNYGTEEEKDALASNWSKEDEEEWLINHFR